MLILAHRFGADRLRIAAKSVAFILVGFALAAWTGQVRMADRIDPALEGKDIQISGHVDGLPIRAERSLRFDFVTLPGKMRLPRKIRLSWYEQGSLPAPGDCLWA